MNVAAYLLLLIFPIMAYGQKSAVGTTNYPQDYFRNPLDIPILLAGNFGECRPGHFHSGLDIKTLGREGQPVRAAADGYVSRIKMDKGGFGHALYVTHPNGYTTLYAHLNDFAPAIQKYLKKQQYAQKRWNVDLGLQAAQFPVKKGEQIAWSGNTGGSSAPHLHFEIRDTKTEHPLNPQLFGFDIKDTIAPVVREVAIYNLDRSIYEREPIIISLKKVGEVYKPFESNEILYPIEKDSINVDDARLGIGINTDDYMDASENTITFLTADLFMDGVLQSTLRLDDIGYDESRYINAYADHRTRKEHGKWIQCFFRLPGNRLNSIYSFLNDATGSVNADDKKIHQVKIIITDNNKNSSAILFYIRPSRHFMPPVIVKEAAKFFVNQENKFSSTGISFSLDERQLYDNINFMFYNKADPGRASDRFFVHYSSVPLHHYFDLKIKSNKTIPAAFKNKVVMKYSDDKSEDGRAAAAIDSGWYSAKVRNFGRYWLDIDTTAPEIVSMQRKNSNLSKARQIAFTVTDNMTSVKTFSGYLDDKWICFEQHGDDFFYKFDEHCAKGKHKLVFKAVDENGNASIQELNFTR